MSTYFTNMIAIALLISWCLVVNADKTECQRSNCEGDMTSTITCQEYYWIRITRVKNIAERTCNGFKICESQIQHPNNTKSKCNGYTKCTFQNMIAEDGQGEQCKTYDEDGNVILHKTTSQEICFECYPVPTT
ncbi:unnamed protein product, partial [Owenia fusiformis]